MQRGTHAATLIGAGIFVADSVTALGAEVGGNVLIAGSHCGVYAAFAAARAKVRAVILNDAGIGLDQAGIGGLAYLERIGIPAAAIDYQSARIGDGRDSAARGVLSHVNELARALGCVPGQRALEAAMRLQAAASPRMQVPEVEEARHCLAVSATSAGVIGLDSASLVSNDDAGRIVVTASHGGLLGADPGTALKAAARAAFFNDAGVGCDAAGISRLPELDRRGIAAGTVSHWTARIGDARSSWQTGVLSHINVAAEKAGAVRGMPLQEFVRLLG